MRTIVDEAFERCSSERTFYGPSGSVAEKYAAENRIRFEAVDEREREAEAE